MSKRVTVGRVLVITLILLGTTLLTSCETTYLETSRKMTNQSSSPSESGDQGGQRVLPVLPHPAT